MSYQHATYIVRDRSEETYCQHCGEPLEVGDQVWTNDPEVVSYTACRRTCADSIASDIAKLERWDEVAQ